MMALLLAFDIFRVPLPFRVTLPLMSRIAEPPLGTLFIWKDPLLVIVPLRYSMLPLFSWNVPLLVTPSRVPSLKQQLAWMLPLPLVVSVPPLTVKPLSIDTTEPESAWMVPPVLVSVPEPLRDNFAPFVASSIPVFVTVPAPIATINGVVLL